MIIKRELTIGNSLQNTWNILGPDFNNAHKWASVVNHSEGSGEGSDGAPCTERVCDISGMGKTKEKIIKYSDTEHILSYQIEEGMPSMVKYASNTWKLFPLDDNRTKLIMQMEVEVGGLMGMIMKPMMKMQMGKMASDTSDDFKYYVENGKPHPRKIRAMNKWNKKTK